MSRVDINIHDLPLEVYEKLNVEEKASGDSNVRWKVIRTVSLDITFFKNEPGEWTEDGRGDD